MSSPEVATFYDLFQTRREPFRQSLAAAPSAEKAARVLDTEVEGLLRAFTSGERLRHTRQRWQRS